MKKTTKDSFQPTPKARVVPRNRRTEVAREARKPHNIKVRTNIHLDLDVINFFKERAKTPGAPPYQTQINAELRKLMSNSPTTTADDILHNEKLMLAIARKVRELV
jgi:uncharacterized protein (DUF4415 family)